MKRILTGLAVFGLALTAMVTLQTPAAATPAGTAATPMAATVIGIEYQYVNWTGPSLTVTGVTCTTTLNDVDNWLSSLPAGWNDTISAFRSYANCWTKLYADVNFGGRTFGYAADSSDLGEMDGTASSITWS